MNADSAKVAKLLKILGGDNGKHIANVIEKVQIKDSEQIRPIVPIEEWINNDYYVGRDARKLYRKFGLITLS